MKTKQRAVFGLWSDVRIGDLNRLLKPYGVRLVLKSSRDWGDQVSVTAHPLETDMYIVTPGIGTRFEDKS